MQRDTLTEEVYGFEDNIQSNALGAHVSRLRAPPLDLSVVTDAEVANDTERVA